MEKQKSPLKKLREEIVGQAKREPSVTEIEDTEHEISEDPREHAEGDIEEEEEAGQEPYPEIEKVLEHDDNPDKEDEEEEE